MTEKGYMSDRYKKLAEVMDKCDSLSQQIKTARKRSLNIFKILVSIYKGTTTVFSCGPFSHPE